MSVQYYLYRYHNADGTAKEWAYADLGNGVAQVRWGRAGALRQAQEKPLVEAQSRAYDKEQKGYRFVGQVWLDIGGNHTSAPVVRRKPAGKVPEQTPHPQKPKPGKKPVNVTELLGGEDGDSWF